MTTLRDVGRRLFRAGRFLVFSGYYAAVGYNHRYELYAPAKRVGDARFRSYELVNKHGRDGLLRALLANCDSGETVVDVGANTGVYSLAVAAARPTARVVAFEPNPAVCEQLRTNVRLNDFEDRVDVRAEGLGSESGTATFYRSTYDELGSFVADNAAGWEARVRDTVEVDVRRLDDLVADGEVPPPDHLKIDVEGFGYDVVTGSLQTIRNHRPVVYFEPHAVADPTRDADAVGDRLRSVGYRIHERENGWVCRPETATETDAGSSGRE
ncbi:methyltransferase, FkbM family [Halogranum gelatinilyticum]|uniref:Methyltransferase, FkbM family n=1 Tax=Halogranum gelatinilyticum TaxID=660521 RepID=A0A1G9QU49_9EURY|nr:FkbM family methyltransferase [Halogranum gelatinilyticum]SDM14390.1 methyltransferase, FkbM family [Halogranum gelatinilyticum]